MSLTNDFALPFLSIELKSSTIESLYILTESFGTKLWQNAIEKKNNIKKNFVILFLILVNIYLRFSI